MMHWVRVVPLCLCAGVMSTAMAAPAQQPATASRIAGNIDESKLVALRGNTPPTAIAKNDRGPVNPSLSLRDLVLVLKRSPQQQQAFDEFVASQYDPSSPNFHHWLTADAVGQTYGPSSADIATISNWLSGHGLVVGAVANDHMSIQFSGMAAQIEATFHTQIHNLTVNGENHVGNMSDPQIPSALAPVVEGVKALHNFFPRPLHRLGSKVTFDPAEGKWKAADTTSAVVSPRAAVAAHPEFGITVGTGTSAYTVEDVTPYDFATIYNVLPLWNSGIDGTGQTIAIAGTSDINTADVATFRSVFGLPAGSTPQTIVANGIDPGQCTSTNTNAPCTIGDLIENTLDVEWAGAVARGANIVLVVSGSGSVTTDTVYSSASYVIQNNTANILNVSYGLCELGLGTAGNAAYNNLWETAATEGIAVFVASGDAGSATCDQGLAANPLHAAEYGLSVSGLASTPYNTAVGGTDFNWGKTASPYWGTTNNSSNGSNALGYVPEVPWNDTCTNPLTLPYLQQWAAALQKAGYNAFSPIDAESACNFVNRWWSTIYYNTNPQVNIGWLLNTIGGGGGASNCITGDGTNVSSCTGGYPKPGWQAGVTGIPSDGVRDLPDVSFFASNGFLGSAYLICVSATGACVTSTTLTTVPTAQEVGGTSVASPAMAGVMALINQKAGLPQGNPNSELYALAARQTYSNCSAETSKTNDGCYFNDPDTGTNAMPCAAGYPNCTIIYKGDNIGVLSGYGATAGFDPATGLGSLNVANVVDNWTSTIGTATATVTVTPAQTSFPLDQALSVVVTVSGSSGTPTGTVSLTGGSYTATVGTLSSGGYTFTIPADALSTGSVTLHVSYSGDTTYTLASATASVTVNKITPTVTATPNSTTLPANVNGLTVTAAVSGGGPTPTGSVTFSVNTYTSSPCTLFSGNCTFVIPSSAFTNGTDTITATYSGDSNYFSASGTTSVTVNILTPTVTVTPSVTSLNTATGMQVVVNVTGSGPTPTGSVTLTGLYQSVPIGATLSGGSYTFNIGPDTLMPGTDTLAVQYLGDTTYVATSSSTTVTVTKTGTTLTVTPSATSLYTNDSLTLSGSVNTSGGSPSGAITVTTGSFSSSTGLYAGQYTLLIPPGSLTAGTDTLTVTYNGDTFYTPSTTSTSVAVTAFTKVPATVTATPNSTSIHSGENLPVVVNVTGADGTATGTVTLTSGSFSSGTWALSGGTATFSVPPNSLTPGSDTITATYSGDATYLPGSTTTTVNVTQSDFTLSASNAPTIQAGGLTQSTIAVNSGTLYSGTVTLSCALTGEPAGASDLPTCSMLVATVALPAGPGGALGFAQVSTTAPTTAMNIPQRGGSNRRLLGTGGLAFALLLFFGLPVRRCKWRSMLGALALLAILGSLGACGGGSTSSGGGSSVYRGTTSGTYTFTVTGTGNPAVTPAPTTTFTVIVS